MRFKLAMYAALAALALGPPLVADQSQIGTMNDQFVHYDQGTAGAVIHQEVQAPSAASWVAGLNTDFQLRVGQPASGFIEMDTSPNDGNASNLNLVYDLHASTGARNFTGSRVDKRSHAVPANAGNMQSICFYFDTDQANKGAPAANRQI